MKDVSGQSFGRLNAHWPVGRKGGIVIWLCSCLCGRLRLIHGSSLRSGASRSCRCAQIVHGHSKRDAHTATYRSWRALIARCTNPNHSRWHRYGGSGVSVCDRWRSSFQNFLADLGERPAGKTLGRFNDSGNYEPGNVAWMTSREQDFNRKKVV